MKKIFTRSLCICMAAALIINIAVVALLQIVVMEHTHTQSSNERLEAVKETLIQNEENIAELTKAVGENNLAKTRAFADLLAADQSILEDKNKMNAVKDRLMVNELHVIDEKGTITHSTVENYIGFDMNSGEQSAAFMPIAGDPSIEIVQEPTVNAAEGIVMQYIGVARKDAPGLVQVGIRPEVLENMLAGKEEVDSFTNYFLNNVHIIHYQVPRDVDLNHYFEVMNSRGKQLEKHEIVKAKLLEKLSQDTDRTRFAFLWESCSHMSVHI